ncbi:hypothetical protein B0T25DRAFT_604914 [Lasiosphaeria hispida]|uniref:Retrovirus-related Pol polyprotein from transposon TNT 1-94-like beta-barrel domain-containing protein n=1 Tax=Lasiosphaeria hispida TaxID=260671 RepID=A0AAJ0HMX2_9PEZI|nr:hypothetical protein B0T25DRAFT_604914 [Lasiosphaeria hispida]
MSLATSTSGLCPDWIFSSDSNVHVAVDRAWFTSYTSFETYSTYLLAGGEGKAVGIGDVAIPVRVHPKRHGPRAHGTLRLHNVLHVPSADCNIFSGPAASGDVFNSVSLGNMPDGTTGRISDGNGRRLAYFREVCGLCALKLSGPPVGPVLAPSRLKKDRNYVIRAFWPDAERKRWAATQSGQLGKTPGTENLEATPYTEKEKEWLDSHFGGEYKREDFEDSELEDEESAFLGHMTDYLFTDAQLEYIEKN